MKPKTCVTANTKLPQRGVAAVEFALLVFLMLLIGAGLVEFGRAVWHYDALTKATRDAARHLSTVPMSSLPAEGTKATDAMIAASTAAGVPGLQATDITITCEPTSCSSASAPGAILRVRVDVAYTMTLGQWFPFIYPPADSTFDITLAPQTTMPYMW